MASLMAKIRKWLGLKRSLIGATIMSRPGASVPRFSPGPPRVPQLLPAGEDGRDRAGGTNPSQWRVGPGGVPPPSGQRPSPAWEELCRHAHLSWRGL